MSSTIDAHQHFWKSEAQEQPWRQASHTRLEQDFEPPDLATELSRSGVDATILMQSVDEPAENERLARYAEDPLVAGAVAWLPLQDPPAARRELETLRIPKLVGVRCLVARDPMEWLAQPASVDLFRDLAARGLVWDVVPITIEQTRAVLDLAKRLPDLRIVVDHLGRPPVESEGWEPWASNMRDLAGCSNVAVKVSVGIDALTAWREWDPDVLDRYVRFIAEQFGPERMMLASNWPVILLRASYEQAWRDLTSLLFSLFPQPADREAVRGGTAERWYGVGGSARSAPKEGVTLNRKP